MAVLLVGCFIEDISMFTARNPNYDVQTLIFDDLLKIDFENIPKSLKVHMVGRSLWTAVSASELVRMHE